MSSTEGLSLAAAPRGPRALDEPQGTLGGLVLPRRMAVDANGVIYLLSGDNRVLRFDADAEEFRALPEVGGDGAEPRQFSRPTSIAVAGTALAVCDTGNQRVQIFSLDSLSLLEIVTVPGWRPLDVASHRDEIFILDAGGNVYRYRTYPGTRERVVVGNVEPPEDNARIALDRAGRLYLLEAGPMLAVFDGTDVASGEPWKRSEEIHEAGDVQDRFTPPQHRVDGSGQFCLAPEAPLGACAPRPQKEGPRINRAASDGDRRLMVDLKSRRVLLFVDAPPKLRNSWGPWNGAGIPVECNASDAWEPVDVVIRGECACVLDRRYGAVWLQRAGRETMRHSFRNPARENRWTRIGRDEHGCLLLLDSGASPPKTEVYSPDGQLLSVRDTAAADFPNNLASLPLATRPPRVFDLDGAAVEPDFTRPDDSPIFASTGTWVSKPFDSRLYRCPWHKIEFELADLPPGTGFTLSTASTADIGHEAGLLWDVAMTGSSPASQEPDADGRFPFRGDCLVQSPEAQFLVIRVTLTGDRFSTPVLGRLRTLYPRKSLLEDLPAVYSADEQSRRFLERLLAAFDVEFERLDERLRHLPAMFDPAAVPPGSPMEYLAAWLDLVFESGWSPEQKRRLLSAAPGLFARRGRPDGLRDYLRAVLSAISGVEPADLSEPGFPLLLEAFRERNFLRLQEGGTPLGQALPLWSASRVARLRLDEFSRIGEADLVSTGDPARDVFHEFAHRFRVYVPAAWVRSRTHESQLRRAIEAEKPAHTRYELCLVASRFQIGRQSTVGVDTIVGGLSPMRLGCRPNEERAPSAGPANGLGRDSLLSGARRRTGAQIQLM